MGKSYLGSCISVFVVQLVLCTMASQARSLDNTTDQSALLELKTRIRMDTQNVLVTWSIATPVCNWTGVTCSTRHQRVATLNLPNMGLFGTIPPHIGNLSFLIYLNISNNIFQGHLPTELASLRRLKLLDVRSNNFSGEIPPRLGDISELEILNMGKNQLHGAVPSTIFNMSSLQVIDISRNNLSGSLPVDVCYNLPSLVTLQLHLNELSGQIPSGLGRCKALQTLAIYNNLWTGSIPREIGNLTMLRKLYLGYDNMSGEIPKEMGNLLRLEIMDIQSSGLKGNIPFAIFNISSLQVFAITDNKLSGNLPEDMCSHLPNLKDFYVSLNQLQGKIPTSLYKCRELQVLALSDNLFSGVIPAQIGNLTMLQELYIGYNNLEGHILKELGNLLSLEILAMQSNGLTGAIPQEIGNLPSLEVLILNSNSLVGQIPPNIFNMSALGLIDFSSNKLSGNIPQCFDLSLPNLEAIYLGGCNLSGTIPNCILNASKLVKLDLAENSLTGFIPMTLGNLKFLELLNLQENYLTSETSSELGFLTSLTNCRRLRELLIDVNPLNGNLPISIGNFSTSLQVFGIASSKIMGSIPKEIGKLSNLVELYLLDNELSGSIPSTLRSLKNLQRLHLEYNRLQGAIPNDLCDLRNLGELVLSGNEISGSIPTCLGNLFNLRYLFLDSNKLASKIPITLWDLKDLLVLNLSSNSLNESLPVDVGVLKVAIRIDLSRNNLSGNIPITIGGLQNLINLSLAHNIFEGEIPQSLGDLISLESLDLSHNSLSGLIPKSLEGLSHLRYLNLSFNRFQGRIPSGGAFVNFTEQSFMSNDALCGQPLRRACTSNSSGQSKTIKVLLKYVLPLTASTLLVLIAILLLVRYRRMNKQVLTEEGLLLPTTTQRRISYLEIFHATSKFDESNLLGTGSFGKVYKGLFPDGMIVAVKVFNLQLEAAFQSFDAECEIMRQIRHRNLVKIISSCSNIDFKALVLEYMPNGSLEKLLYSHNYCLNILQRLNIMIDVASALEYLHYGYSIPVIHCDLKPNNVLLDEEMVAHVGDFGIGKLLDGSDSVTQTKTLATIGYMAPEYGMEGLVSRRGDVYSYGIMLMETFTRKKPTDDMFVGEMSLKSWVRESLPDAVIEVIDANLILREEPHFAAKVHCLSSIMEVALDCTIEVPEARINMKDVLARLEKIKAKFVAVTGPRRVTQLYIALADSQPHQ